jgi:hypothetical protein
VPLLAEAKAKGLAVTADEEKDIGYLATCTAIIWRAIQSTRARRRTGGKGIIAVEELEGSVEVLMTAIRAGLTPALRRGP